MDDTGPYDPTTDPYYRSNPSGAAPSGRGFQPFGNDGLTFGDILDVINPLQHIPVISTLYRSITGDEIDPIPRVAGGALFGGVIGAVASLLNVAIEDSTGRDVGDHLLALVDTEPAAGDTPTEPTQLAAVDSPVREHLDVLEWARREAPQVAVARAGSIYTGS